MRRSRPRAAQIMRGGTVCQIVIVSVFGEPSPTLWHSTGPDSGTPEARECKADPAQSSTGRDGAPIAATEVALHSVVPVWCDPALSRNVRRFSDAY